MITASIMKELIVSVEVLRKAGTLFSTTEKMKQLCAETYLGPCQTPMMELFAKIILGNIYLSNISNKSIRKMCKMCSKLIRKLPEHVIYVVLVLIHTFSTVSIVDLLSK